MAMKRHTAQQILEKRISWPEHYSKGQSYTQIAKQFGVAPTTVYRHLKELGVKFRSISETKIGELNPMWVGDRVKYVPLHAWVGRNFPKPEFCVDCKLKPPRDAANISGQYKRDLSDWEWLCRSCHMIKDGRILNLKQSKK